MCPAPFPRAQEDHPCAPELDAKTIKLIEKGTDKRKYDCRQAAGYLEEALEAMKTPHGEVSNWACCCYKAEERTGIWRSPGACSSVHRRVPAYDAEVPYTLGHRLLQKGVMTRLEWFDRFIRWEHSPESPCPPRAITAFEDVKKHLPEIEFLVGIQCPCRQPTPQVL